MPRKSKEFARRSAAAKRGWHLRKRREREEFARRSAAAKKGHERKRHKKLSKPNQEYFVTTVTTGKKRRQQKAIDLFVVYLAKKSDAAVVRFAIGWCEAHKMEWVAVILRTAKEVTVARGERTAENHKVEIRS